MTFPGRLLRRVISINPVAWMGYGRLMRRRIGEFERRFPAASDGPRTLVVVAPWDRTAVPWLTLALGVMLAARGARTTFVVDDLPFGGHRWRHSVILAAIRIATRELTRRFEVLTLSQVAAAPYEGATQLIAQVAALNATWELRGERRPLGRAELEARNRRQLGESLPRIAALLAQGRFDLMLTAGGVFGSSALWARIARERGIRIASYDNGGFGTWVIATGGLACHLGDVPRAVRWFDENLSSDDRARAIEIARAELGKRWQGTSTFNYQVGGAEGGDDARARGGIMLALNSSWDSAALGIHDVFSSNQEWIVETVRHLLDNSDVPVVVRQHPAERFEFARTTDDYRALLAEHFGNNSRLWFIAADDPVNTYALLGRVAAVVVHSSTIGNEAAAMGRVVVTASSSYYADLGFAWHGRTAEQYRQVLDDAAAGRLDVSDAMQEKALLCYYTAQVCNWVHSSFNPEAFKVWSRSPLQHWYEEPATARVLDAILAGVPAPVVNHTARVDNAG